MLYNNTLFDKLGAQGYNAGHIEAVVQPINKE